MDKYVVGYYTSKVKVRAYDHHLNAKIVDKTTKQLMSTEWVEYPLEWVQLTTKPGKKVKVYA